MIGFVLLSDHLSNKFVKRINFNETEEHIKNKDQESIETEEEEPGSDSEEDTEYTQLLKWYSFVCL